MQSSKSLAAAGALSLLATTGAWAEETFHGWAKLANPVSAPMTAKVSGVTWTCERDVCTGEGRYYNSPDGSLTECKKVAAALGQLVAYEARGRDVKGGTLGLCNTAASARPGGASSSTAK